MKRLFAIYFYQQLNAVIVSLYLMHLLGGGELLILQMLYLGLLLFDVMTFHPKASPNRTSVQRRFKWICIGLVVLILVSFMLSLFHPSMPNNQSSLIQAQKEVPPFSFLLFLFNASVVEEFLYREILWKLITRLDMRFALTTVLFAFAHHSSSIVAWCLYGFMGFILALVRHKTDLMGSIGLHVVWNVLVFVILM